MYLKVIPIIFLLGSSSLSAETTEQATKVKNSVTETTLQESSTSSNENPYLTESQNEEVKKYLPASTLENKYSSNNELSKKSEPIQLQIASFSTQENANNFMDSQKSETLTMKVLVVYSKALEKMQYKVVILCNTLLDAKSIINTNQYEGAYIYREKSS